MKYITTFFVLMLLPLLAQAQMVTLDECQQLAQENYPLIKQYDLIKQTTDYNVDNISKGWLPQISAMAQATYQSDVMTLPDPLQKMLGQQGFDVKGLRKDQYRVGIDLNQMVYDGGLISGQKNVARLEGEVQNAQTATDLYAIRQRVNDIYFGILLLDEKIQLNKDLQVLLQSNLDKLNSMFSNGIAMQSDVNIISAEILKAEQQATELESSRKSLMDMLSVFIGKKFTDLAIPQDVMVPTMENNRPELRLFDAQIELANAQEKLLNTSLFPKLSVFAQGYYGYPGYDQFDAMFNRDWKLNGMLGVRLSWNIGALYTRKNDRLKLKTRRGLVDSARETFLFNNRLTEIQQTDGIVKYRQMIMVDREIVELRRDVRLSAESRLEHGIIDTNNLLQEITRENQSCIDLSTHTILMLKESYDLKYTTNNETTIAMKKVIILMSAVPAMMFTACGNKDVDYDASGVFETTEVIVSAKGTGEIISLNVEEGQTVKENQPLGELDMTQLVLKKQQLYAGKDATTSRKLNTAQQVASLRQQIANLQSEQARFKALLKDGAATRKQVDDIGYQIATLQKQLAAANEQVSTANQSIDGQSAGFDAQIGQVDDMMQQAVITSPINGVILSKYVEAGEFAVPGRALFKVADVSYMKLRAYITADLLTGLRIGQKVKVYADQGVSGRKTYEGTVSWISSEAEFTPKTIQTRDERSNLVYAIKITVRNDDGLIKRGMYGDVKL